MSWLLWVSITGFWSWAGEKPGRVALYPELVRRHVVMVDRLGRHLDPARIWKLPGAGPECDCTRSFEAIRQGVVKFKEVQPQGRVLVFVHGGLNAYSASRDRLERWLPAMGAEGIYPILVVWNSGFLSAYGEHLTLIRQGEQSPVLGISTAPFVLGVDLGKGLARLPVTLGARYKSDLQTAEWMNGVRVRSWEEFEGMVAGAKGGELGGADDSFMKVAEAELGTRGTPERLVRSMRYWLTQPTKIVTQPVIDGFGAEAWEIMKRRTKTMFEPPLSYGFPNAHRRAYQQAPTAVADRRRMVEQWLKAGSGGKAQLTLRNGTTDGTMLRFAYELEAWTRAGSPLAEGLTWEFYGHSMGTMVLNELFRHGAQIGASRIVYMAAACSIRDFENALIPYLIDHPGTRFYSLSLHRVRESGECMDFGLDLIPRGSLLSHIDEVFERPETVADRSLGAWRNLVRSAPDFGDIPQSVQQRMRFVCQDLKPWADYGGAAAKLQPQKHGDFSKSKYWDPEFLNRREFPRP